ncbi:MAG TPA: two-component regulator propeller domain-containing protein, partial [Kofleriaceae bacterium]|nr:two-component regulator propeller domain-containing protein [Kofleriaceae bacterium]
MRCALVLWVIFVLTASARGDHLPARVYTTADGLANNRVDRCTHDTHGFLWFATEEGVSRFDGQRFESFGVADGLPAATTHDVLATRDGRVWAATDAGVAVLDTRERVVRARFRGVTADAAFALLEDPTGVVWAGTATGLARIDHDRVTPIAIKPVLAIAYDAADRSLWLGTSSGLVHRTAGGQLRHIHVAPAGILDDRVPSLLVDRDHRLWVGAISLHIIVAPLPLATPPEGVALWDAAEHAPGTIRLEPDGGVRRGIYQDPKGTIWIGTTMHLHRWDGHALEIVRNDPLESYIGLSPCVVDSGGNLWLGTDTRGVVRVAPGGLVSYDTRDGLDAPAVYAFVEEPGGPVHVITWRDGHVLARQDGDRFVAVRPHAPAGVTIMAWGWNQTVIIDRDHRWWYPTAQGVLRYPRVATTEELATAEPRLYGVADGLPGRDVFRIYEDRRGDVWISTLSATGLARWDRATDRITVPRGFPHDEASAFAEDHSGALWIGYTGTVVRVRDGVPEVFGAADGIPAGGIGALLVDRAGRLWIASFEQGVARI